MQEVSLSLSLSRFLSLYFFRSPKEKKILDTVCDGKENCNYRANGQSRRHARKGHVTFRSSSFAERLADADDEWVSCDCEWHHAYCDNFYSRNLA